MATPNFDRMVLLLRKALKDNGLAVQGTVFGSALEPEVWEQHYVEWKAGNRKAPDIDLAFGDKWVAGAYAGLPVESEYDDPMAAAISGDAILLDVWVADEDGGLYDQTDSFSTDLFEKYPEAATRVLSAIEDGISLDDWFAMQARREASEAVTRMGRSPYDAQYRRPIHVSGYRRRSS